MIKQNNSDPAAPGERPVRLINVIGYGVGDIYGGGAFLIVGMLFMFFLTEVVGLKPALAGLMFGAGKIWDGISDPLMGYISDRTKSSHGRRRVYFLWGAVPVALTFVILWLPIPSDSQAVLFAYYLFAYILLDAAYTMVMTPYSALPAEMSADFKVRNRLSTSRLLFSGLSSLVAAVVPAMILGAFPDAPGTGHLVMGIVFGTIFALPWVFVYRTTWENPAHGDQSAGTASGAVGILSDFLTILRNRSFRIHFLMYVAAYTAMDVLMALFTYYLTYYMRRPGLYSLAMGSLMVAQLVMMPAYTAIANRRGKATAYTIGLSIWAVGMVLTTQLGPESATVAIALVCAFIGTGTSAGVLIPYMILPFVIDVDELMTGRQRSGVYAGAMTLMRKLVQGAIALPMIGFMLQSIGFIPNQAQSQATLTSFFTFFIGVPAILIVAGIAAASRFRINPRTHAVLERELIRLRAGGQASEVEPETRRICELLSGIPYDSCQLATARDSADEGDRA
ncbi:MAG: MFS transporter [Spirochaetales bacterium]|nr:MFS transporter [Spirochaetales bacterium]